MGTVIAKVPNDSGVYRFIEHIDETKFDETDWERNPDVSNVQDIKKRYWKYDGTNVVTSISQEEKVSIDNDRNVEQNDFGTIDLAWRGTAVNRWLKGGAGLGIDTKSQPILLRNAGVITALGFSNAMDNASGDIEIYINGTLKFTWEVRDVRFATKSSGLGNVQFAAGDLLSVYARRHNSTKASWITLNIDYRYTILTKGEDSKSTV